MKKLLGILGTIIISGSGMTGIVANSPIPAKQKNQIKTGEENINMEITVSGKNYTEANKEELIILVTFMSELIKEKEKIIREAKKLIELQKALITYYEKK
ncbi:hypothetical protein [Spiroplasma endosymbiont of 'Nebria riversi']|uniref:hypothetical protein n=1 Tax=Spiroplasma endosymbiont of 'Nebria riversi' TaxID=2792084 RepID=UPI001C052D6F|nr:hypothetical protein [Spiroplasma endosymbiont of 'Nebria riversi']